MPVVTCPECLAKFDSSGARGTSCPTCGHRLGSARRPTADRRSYRRTDDEDDYDDRRPARRPRRAKSTATDSLVPLLILGGVLFVVVAVGGIGFLVYRGIERAPSRPRDVAEARPVAAPDDDLPGVSPADLNPGGQPGFGPPNFPQPGDPSLPGIDPSQVRPPRRQQPPDMTQPPGAAVTVTLSNLRRGRGAGTVLEVDYEYTAGSRHPVFDKLIVRTADGTGEVDLLGPPQRKGTIRIRAIGAFGRLQGKVEVWMERRSSAAHPGADGQVISNTVTLD
jgi:DNA-directed RNA polymerase subunit RPC12/RpoP